MKVIIDIEHKDHTDIVLTNSNGDTFTSTNEELQDFFSSEKEFKFDVTHCSIQLKNKEEIAFDLWLKNFKKTKYGYWFDERTVYCIEAMKDIYKTSVKPKL